MSELVFEDSYNLPTGWSMSSIGDITENSQYGWTTSASNVGKIKLLRTTDITHGIIDWETVPFCKNEPKELEKYLLHNGDIVISRAGSVGVSYLIKNPEKSVFASYLIRFKPLIDSTYISYFLQSPMFWNQIKEKSAGIALLNVNATKIKQMSIPIAPLTEQKRIVSKIGELIQQCNSVKVEIKKIRDLLKQFHQSVLISAFNGNLVSQNYSDKPADELLSKIFKNMDSSQNMDDDTNKKIGNTEHNVLPPDFIEQRELPKGWCWTKIGKISVVIRGASPRPAGDPRYFGGNIPWITVGSITNDENIYLTNVPEFVTEEGCIRSRYVEPETLLLTNSGATLGVPKITKIGGCINDGSVALLNLDNPLKTYLYYYFLSLTKKLRSINQGAAQPNLNTGIVKSISVPIAPMNEQTRIVSKLEEMFSSISQVNSVIKEIERRMDATSRLILEKAFTGKLVPQDPNDESSEILLQKIKQEKEKLQKNQKVIKAKSIKTRRMKNAK